MAHYLSPAALAALSQRLVVLEQRRAEIDQAIAAAKGEQLSQDERAALLAERALLSRITNRLRWLLSEPD